MVEKRLTSVRVGDSAELLAEFVLGHVAFTTRVARQDDVGHDLHCTLRETRGRTDHAGPYFTVQVKSAAPRTRLVYKTTEETLWLRGQANPFFFCVADPRTLRVEVFWTRPAIDVLWVRPAPRIELVPGLPKLGAHVQTEWVTPGGDARAHTVWLGEPVIAATASEITNAPFAAHLVDALRCWLYLEQSNIVNTRTGLYWTLRPVKYGTNAPLGPGEYDQTIVTNAANLGPTESALVQRAVDALVVRQDSGRWVPDATSDDGVACRAVAALIRSLRDRLPPTAHAALARRCPEVLDA